jgi:hypothetical protein
VTLLLSLSCVNSAEITVTSTYTTSEIQNIISSTNNDIIFEGEFNNLSTLNINRNIIISGKNATILRNTSNPNNVLFNITSSNVTIENLTIRGYNGAIYSNTSYILIQNNQIIANGIGINITTNYNDLNNSVIKNNNITTTGANSYGVYLRSNNGALNNNIILGNNITTSAHGVYLHSLNGSSGITNSALENNIIICNNINVAGSSHYGIYVYGDHINVKNNNISNNTIETSGTSNGRGISLIIYAGVGINNSISSNNISTIGSSSYGIYLYTFDHEMNNTNIWSNNINVRSTAILVGAGTNSYANINNLNISYNRILTNSLFINLTEHGSNKGTNNTASANWFGNNTPDMARFLNINVLSYYVVNASPYKNTGIVGEDWLINYTFYLNNTHDMGEYDKLPFFKARLLNMSNEQIGDKIAYLTELWNMTIKYPRTEEFTIVLDYENIILDVVFSSDKGNTILSMGIDGELNINKTVTINTVLKNIQGQTLANKNITFLVNGQVIESKISDSDGKVSFYYTFNSSGIYTFQVIFDGDDDYDGSNNFTGLAIPKIDTFLNLATEGDIGINKTIKLVATLSHQTPIAGKWIIFKLNNEIIGKNITNTNGEAYYHYTPNNPEIYNFQAIFEEDDEYNGSNNSIILTIPKSVIPELEIPELEIPELSVPKINTFLNLATEGDIGINKTIKLVATLSHQSLIAGKWIIFKLNNEIIGKNITNTNGEAYYHYTLNNPEIYNFQAIFEEDDEYNGSNNSIILTIPKLTVPQKNESIIPEPEANITPDLKPNNIDAKNKSINNQDKNIPMKNTGIPIINILLLLLMNLGLIISKKYKF